MWAKIKGYDNYSVSSNGEVRNDIRMSILKPNKNCKGYLYVILSKDNKQVNKKIHRLVAESFLPNPNNKPTVNHINGIKTDNNVNNLEWATNQENSAHYWQNLATASNRYRLALSGYRRSYKRKVLRINDNKTYSSITEAALDSNTTESLICQVCKGKRKTTGGYSWKYIES